MVSRCCAVRVAISLGMLLMLANTVSAQVTVPAHSLRGLLSDLGAKVASATGVSSELAVDFDLEVVLMSLEVSNAPYGMSTGSFTFTFDSQLGTFKRSTETFGPTFGKRSLTIGKGKVSAGFNWMHARYDSIGGLDLTNGDFRRAKNAKSAEGTPLPFSYSTVLLNLTSDTYVGFVSYGVTNDFDVGVAVPWVRVSVAADVGLFSSTDVDLTPGGHLFVLPSTAASGVGDIAVFGKYRVWHHNQGGLAAEIELRLPSGATNDLRGAGITRTLVSVIWSGGGNVSPHANVGYEFWSRRVPHVFTKNQINYVFGVELKAHSRATAIIDVIGRRLLHGGQIGYRTMDLGAGTAGGTAEILSALPKGLDVISFAPGVKWNVAGNVLLTANALAAIANRGVRANIIPVVGLEWAF